MLDFFFNRHANNNNKSKVSPLRGTSDMEHTSFYLLTHPLTYKKLHKQKVFKIQPLRNSRNLAQQLKNSVWFANN